jgi:hypothetical protein
MHQMITIILASLTCISAVTSAFYWWKSSQAKPLPIDMFGIAASVSDVPEQHIGAAQVNIAGMQAMAIESARLNKCAAIWTAVSALLSAATTMAGICLPPASTRLSAISYGKSKVLILLAEPNTPKILRFAPKVGCGWEAAVLDLRGVSTPLRHFCLTARIEF